MSADAITVCPACYARATGKTRAGIQQRWRSVDAMELQTEGYKVLGGNGAAPNQLREFHEAYIENGCVYFRFHATCRECGYDTGHLTLVNPLPVPEDL